MQLKLDDSNFTVANGEITLQLLPKEYALLDFMYRNKGRTFTRGQLLDKVWPLEYPVERTVDDHIYRLRKKLRPFAGLTLQTVRGSGYSLSLAEAAPVRLLNPTTHDTELRNTMTEVFNKFHVYGQGRSMLSLASQKDVLGYELDPQVAVSVHFVQGDLEWLMHTEEVALKDRLFHLFLFYMFTGEPEVKLAVCERVISAQVLHPEDQLELDILTILDLFILAGEPERALDRLVRSYQVISEPEYENFVPVTMITELFAQLAAGAGNEVLMQMDEAIVKALQEKPFLRETGSYNIVKGLWQLRNNQPAEAEALLDEGLDVLERSGFVPLRLYGFYRICHYCRLYLPSHPLHRKYERRFAAVMEDIGLDRYEQRLEELLMQVLKS
ncbi:winged helix-turn-helix domain-containing protein [Paenibacillus camerounensis]|uniref:winged helix-turn-helix domain-containing protein n=1 Tax=Paenibacillus camerounensis TaxID=1243663 RepID=UPI0005A8CEC0|nr:winged helix-turn-helix domain-containing protein [Paenibacillus camerounensis]